MATPRLFKAFDDHVLRPIGHGLRDAALSLLGLKDLLDEPETEARAIAIKRKAPGDSLQAVFGRRLVQPLIVRQLVSRTYADAETDADLVVGTIRQQSSTAGRNVYLDQQCLWGIGPIDGVERLRLGADNASQEKYKNAFRAVHRLGETPPEPIDELLDRHGGISPTPGAATWRIPC